MNASSPDLLTTSACLIQKFAPICPWHLFFALCMRGLFLILPLVAAYAYAKGNAQGHYMLQAFALFCGCALGGWLKPHSGAPSVFVMFRGDTDLAYNRV